MIRRREENTRVMMLQELGVLELKGIRGKIDRKLVLEIEWSNGLADELHHPIRRTFVNRQVFAIDVDAIWSADLVEMQPFAKQNRGYKYILIIIDVFSKYGWAILPKTKTGLEVTKHSNTCGEHNPHHKNCGQTKVTTYCTSIA